MKILDIRHKGILYEFRYLSKAQIVEVMKDMENHPYDNYTYILRRLKSGWKCSCPSGRFRGYCWHKDQLKELISQPDIREPWTGWAENAPFEGMPEAMAT